MKQKNLKMKLATLSLAVLGCVMVAQVVFSSATASHNLLAAVSGSSHPSAQAVAGSGANPTAQNVPSPWVWLMQEGRDVSAEVGIPGARAVRLIRDERGPVSDEPVVVTQVPLGRGTTADFRVEPFDVFTADARIVATASGVETLLPRPTVKLYRGRSLDGSDGFMFLSVNGSRFRAVIEHGGEMTFILPASGRGDVSQVVIPGGSLPQLPLDNFCSADLLPENRAFIERFSEGVDQALSVLTNNRLQADLMLDVNYSLYNNVFGHNTTTTTNYATDLIGAVSAIYERDVNVQLVISTLTIWTTPDPFGGSSSSQQLANYRNYVLTNRSGISRDMAHLLANGNVTNYGGIAYLDVLCNNSYSFGVSNIYGDVVFPAPGYAWDLFVVSHELGHNFGSVHTHCYVPPIDMCYNQEPGCYNGPVVPSTGTIMSYCHLTSGGVILVFHQRTIDVIRPRAEAASCLNVVSTSPTITVSVPNGGENWQTGASQTIQWTSSNVTGNVKIELSRTGSGGSFETLFADTSNDGSQSWTVAGTTTTQAVIKISSVSNPSVNDVSNSTFTISEPPPQPSVTVTSPNGGEYWQTGTTQTITWTSTGISGNVRIRLSRNGGASYSTLFNSVANTGSIQWTVTGPATTQARIQVVSLSNSNIRDSSDGNFTISNSPPPTPTITVTAPNGGENWAVGTTQTMQWTSSNLSGNVKIELSRTGSGGPFETLFANTANDGSQSWTVAGATSSTCLVKISSVDNPSVNDLSNAAFTISSAPPASIMVTAPNGGENWPTGTTQTITWTSTGVSGNVKIELSRTGSGGPYETLFADTPNDGSQSWTVTGPATTQAVVKISSLSNPAVSDTSNATFTVSEPPAGPSITVISPNGGETWPVRTTQTIRWTSSGIGSTVKIRLSRNGGASYSAIFNSVPNTGSVQWVVSGPTSSQCKIQVVSADGTVRDASDGNFSITP